MWKRSVAIRRVTSRVCAREAVGRLIHSIHELEDVVKMVMKSSAKLLGCALLAIPLAAVQAIRWHEAQIACEMNDMPYILLVKTVLLLGIAGSGENDTRTILLHPRGIIGAFTPLLIKRGDKICRHVGKLRA